MSVHTADEAGSPKGALYVTVDDGTARPVMTRSRAVPAADDPSRDAAHTDPTGCERVHGRQSVCWRYWQVVGGEIRVWTTYRDRSCVIVGNITDDPTRVLCDGIPVTT